MSRKKWTPREDQSPALFENREKRKWQIALRRYVFLQSPCTYYAPFFGLDAVKMREWVATQFTEGMNWDNFSDKWYFGHVLSPAFFNFSREEDMKLCWNFLNISVMGKNAGAAEHAELAQAKQYYQELHSENEQDVPALMLKKIETAEIAAKQLFTTRVEFAGNNREYINKISGFDAYQFEQLNNRVSAEDIIKEQELFKKF